MANGDKFSKSAFYVSAKKEQTLTFFCGTVRPVKERKIRFES